MFLTQFFVLIPFLLSVFAYFVSKWLKLGSLLLMHTLHPPSHSPQINWKTSSLRLSSELVMHHLPLLFLSCLDPTTGQELGTDRRIGRLFEISSLRLPATGVSSATPSSPSLSFWHSRLEHASSS